MDIVSPITQKNNVIFENEISTKDIIRLYQEQIKINISKIFADQETIKIYKCLDTGYRFYYPFSISGDDKFYQELEKLPWYYSKDKWEHSIALKYINNMDKVLEIGCAKGSFLKDIKNKGAQAEGLELNTSALASCKRENLSVYPDSIEDFSKTKHQHYDIVCNFQVLEHISNIKSFLNSSLDALRPGGLMIISVPNNDCLIFKSNNICLNMPPHHTGLWNINSLISLQHYFNMNVESIHLEPMQVGHIDFANKIINKKIEKKLKQKFGILSTLLKKPTHRIARLGASAISEHVIGHSVLIVFKKST